MSRNTKLTILIVNTVLCVVLLVVSAGVMIASVMGGAAAHGHEVLGTMIVILGMGAPAMPLLSIAGSWATMKWTPWSMTFVALPYVYGLVLAGMIALLFAQ